jgi:antitoxin component HigA of HigAB toxin-antitoxin module
MKNTINIKKIIVKRMKELDFNNYKLSKLSKVSESQLSRFFNDKRTLTLPVVESILKVLKLTIKPMVEKLND